MSDTGKPSDHLVWLVPLVIAVASALAWMQSELVPDGLERVAKLEVRVDQNAKDIEELKNALDCRN